MGGGSIQMRKLLTKLFARVGAAYLPPRVAKWRYQRGRRSLLDNLSVAQKRSSSSGGCVAPSASNNGNKGREGVEGGDGDSMEDELFHVPDPVEDAAAQLLSSLADPATVVRWSAAKGLGRIAERLPRICADDVLDYLLGELFSDELDERRSDAWHGGCLALAELARRGLLLPGRLNEAVNVVVGAMRYDVTRAGGRRSSVGAHVRDAACYVAWAFARAYAPGVLRPHVPALAEAVVLTALFDREVNGRRAAGAAFQECVGRQGAENFKHGIAILTAANYFSLGNRTEAYTTVAVQVASFEEYRIPIIRHVFDIKLSHWDAKIRSLSARALHDLTPLDPAYVAREALPRLVMRCVDVKEDPAARHGAVLGVAEAVLALGEARDRRIAEGAKEAVPNGGSDLGLDRDVASSLAELVPSIERARLYRGRCGEEMRAAVVRLIECLSLANLPLTVKQQVYLLDSVDDCLKHPKEEVQNAAASGLYALMRSYFPAPNGPSERLQKRVVDKYVNIVMTEDNPAATRGFALALGKLPRKLLAPNATVLGSVLSCLCDAARVNRKVGNEGDAETRRNALVALAAVCAEVGVDNHKTAAGSKVVGLSGENLSAVFNSLLASMEDYNSDRRGDVGSWSRNAAMNGLVSLSFIAIRASMSVPHCRTNSSGTIFTSACDRRFIAPPLSEKMLFLETNASAKVAASLMQNEPLRSHSANIKRDDECYFDERMCARVIGALLKQLAEKLDSVRHVAGTCLERLLTHVSLQVPFVPNRALLMEALNLNCRLGDDPDQKRDINWASPSETFPLVMRAVNIDQFFDYVLSGMVISVGGLTKNVTHHSSSALLQWLKSLKRVGAKPTIAKAGNVLLCMFDNHHRDGRVINPLLKTIDMLLSHRCLDDILLGKDSGFPMTLLLKLQREAKDCCDVKRLLSTISVLLGLLHEKETKEVNSQTMHFLMILLAHRYPRVRRSTAEQLYVKMLEDWSSFTEEQETIDEVTRLLLEVAWDQELDPPGIVRECRNRVSDLLGVELSSRERERPMKHRADPVVVDTFESYASLVNDAGR